MLKTVRQYCKSIKVSQWVMILVFMILTALDGIVIPEFTARMIELANQKTASGLIETTVLIIVLYLIVRTALYCWQITQQRMIRNINVFHKNKLVERYLHSQLSSAQLDQYVLGDIKTIEQNFLQSLFNFIYCIFFAGITLVYVLTIDFVLSLLFLGFAVLPILVTKLFKTSIQTTSKQYSEDNQSFLKMYKNMVNGLSVLINFNVREFFMSRYEDKLQKTETSYEQMNKRIYQSNWVANIISGFSSFLPLAFGVYLISMDRLSLPSLMAVYLASDRIISPLINSIAYYSKMMSAISLIEAILEVEESPDNRAVNVRNMPTILPIKVNNLSLTYNTRVIFKEISFEIEKGDKVLIIGPSGSGKSSLLNLIFGLQTPTAGCITYHDSVITGIPDKMGYYQQNVFLFDDSLKVNIGMGREDVSDSEIESALKRVNLGYLLEKYSLEEDSIVWSEVLSGGEKARIALARILVSDYDVILMDEFSSSLDKQTAQEIRSIILHQYSTVIEVSHHYNDEDMHLFNKVIEVNPKDEVVNLLKK